MAAPAKKAKTTTPSAPAPVAQASKSAPKQAAKPAKEPLPWRRIGLLALAFAAGALVSIVAAMGVKPESDPNNVIIRVIAGVVALVGLVLFALGYLRRQKPLWQTIAFGGASLVTMAHYTNTVQEPWFAIPGLLLGLAGLMLDLNPETKVGMAFLLTLSCIGLVQGTGAESGLGNIGLTCLLGVLLLLWAGLPDGRWRTGPAMVGLIATALLVLVDIYLIATGFTVARLILLPIAAVLCGLFFLLRYNANVRGLKLPTLGGSRLAAT